jgi:hypothetical protein
MAAFANYACTIKITCIIGWLGVLLTVIFPHVAREPPTIMAVALRHKKVWILMNYRFLSKCRFTVMVFIVVLIQAI